jgi:hypothetical protein
VAVGDGKRGGAEVSDVMDTGTLTAERLMVGIV